jgi:hypothetical protein
MRPGTSGQEPRLSARTAGAHDRSWHGPEVKELCCIVGFPVLVSACTSKVVSFAQQFECKMLP